MRLLLTTDTIGGVWTFTKELTQGLLDEGHAVALASLGRSPDADQQAWADGILARFSHHFEYHPTNSPLEWQQDNAAAFTHSAALLERLAASFRADLIHSSQFCFGALTTRIPILITAHSDVLSWAQSCQPEALAETPWLTLYKSLVQQGLAQATALIAPTTWMLEALRANFRTPQVQFAIPNGRTLAQPADSECPIDGAPGDKWDHQSPEVSHVVRSKAPGDVGLVPPIRRLQAVTAGRLWDKGKNLTLLTQHKSPIPLVIAGETPLDSPLPDVTFTGHLPEQSLLNLFQESALYICSSKYEPFGLAPLEAALCGCAVLTNDIPTLREVWQDAALYFDNASSLERLLTQLATHPEQLAAAQVRSHARAQCFSRGRMAAAYLDCYREILKQQESAHAA